MAYDPGKLSERVTIERLSESRFGGEVSNNWSTLTTLWAEVLPRGSRESWRQTQAMTDMEYLVRIRRYTGITSKDRVVWNGKNLEIAGLIEAREQQTEVTELYCIEAEEVH